MPTFVYTAISSSGVELHGHEAAASSEQLREILQGRGLLVRRIEPERAGLAALRMRRVASSDVVLFLQELAALLRAGLPLVHALEHCAERPDAPRLGRVLAGVVAQVRGGESLSRACAQFPDVFDGLLVAALQTAEKTGRLHELLAQQHAQMTRQIALRTRLRQAMAYPLFLMMLLAVVVAALFIFVMPRFRDMYADLGAGLPAPTQLLLTISAHAAWLVPLGAVFGVFALAGLRSLLQREAPRRRIHAALERMPLLGTVWTQACAAQYTRALATLLAGGTPLAEALRVALAAVGSASYAARAEQAAHAVVGGEPLAASWLRHAVLPSTGARLVAVGEASGQLAEMLAETARHYDERVEQRLARWMAVAEPLLMLFTGLIVGSVIVVMYLPVFRLVEVIR